MTPKNFKKALPLIFLFTLVSFQIFSKNTTYKTISISIQEPSGIVFHPKRNTFFVVGDEGHIAEFAKNGKNIRQIKLGNLDFEAITLNPLKNLLYLADEKRKAILEIDINFKIKRTFFLENTFKNKLIFPKGKHGIESLTYSSKSKTFYFANQITFKKRENKTYITEFKLPENYFSSKVKYLNIYPVKMLDISGMQFDDNNNQLIIISDYENSLIRINEKGLIKSKRSIPGKSQEGVTLDNNGNIFILQENNKTILKLSKTPRK